MSVLRTSPSPSIQASHQMILNKTKAVITTILSNSIPNHNGTINEINIALTDPNPNPIQLDYITSINTYYVILVIIAFALIGYIGFVIVISPYKDNWIINKYKQFIKTETLPTSRPKKAKESPFVGPAETPSILPFCPRLDGSEKGQNIMFRFRGSTNTRFESSHIDNETRITIISVMENSTKPPLIPKV